MISTGRIDTAALTLLQQFQRPASSTTQPPSSNQLAGIDVEPVGADASPPRSQAAAAIGAATIDWAAKAQERAAHYAQGIQMMEAHLTWLQSTPGSSTQSDRMKTIESAQRGMSMIKGLYELYTSGKFERLMTGLHAGRPAALDIPPEQRQAEVAEILTNVRALRERMES